MPSAAPAVTLSQTQRLILDEAARHPARRLARPSSIKAPTYRSALQALRRRGLIADGPTTGGPATDGPRRVVEPVLTQTGLALLGLDTAPTEQPSSVEHAPPAQPAGARAPREGTKQALLVAMLTGPDGASLDQLAAATGWLPHTTRAALTGLRKRGLSVLTVRAAGETTRYRLAAEAQATTDAGSDAVNTATASAEARR